MMLTVEQFMEVDGDTEVSVSEFVAECFKRGATSIHAQASTDGEHGIIDVSLESGKQSVVVSAALAQAVMRNMSQLAS